MTILETIDVLVCFENTSHRPFRVVSHFSLRLPLSMSSYTRVPASKADRCPGEAYIIPTHPTTPSSNVHRPSVATIIVSFLAVINLAKHKVKDISNPENETAVAQQLVVGSVRVPWRCHRDAKPGGLLTRALYSVAGLRNVPSICRC